MSVHPDLRLLLRPAPLATAVLAVGAIVAVSTGLLPGSGAYDVAVSRGGPVLGFLVGITVLSDLADRAGVFAVAASGCSRMARGSRPALFALVAALATVTTIAMSLDTTAVLLTPVVLGITARLGLRAEPFALLVVWLANTASLLLPVSNLTNLLALEKEQLSTAEFAGRMGLPEVGAVLVTTSLVWLLYRRDLTGRFDPVDPEPVADRLLFQVCAAACLVLVVGVVAGATPWMVALPCAAVAAVATVLRPGSPTAGGWLGLVPWRILVFTEALFLVVSAAGLHGLTHLLADLSGQSSWRSLVTAGVASNVVNNLPAYLAVESAVPSGHVTQLLAVLIGTNATPLILPWASLATLLWREKCAAAGVQISVARLVGLGALGVPLVAAASWGLLLVTG